MVISGLGDDAGRLLLGWTVYCGERSSWAVDPEVYWARSTCGTEWEIHKIPKPPHRPELHSEVALRGDPPILSANAGQPAVYVYAWLGAYHSGSEYRTGYATWTAELSPEKTFATCEREPPDKTEPPVCDDLDAPHSKLIFPLYAIAYAPDNSRHILRSCLDCGNGRWLTIDGKNIVNSGAGGNAIFEAKTKAIAYAVGQNNIHHIVYLNPDGRPFYVRSNKQSENEYHLLNSREILGTGTAETVSMSLDRNGRIHLVLGGYDFFKTTKLRERQLLYVTSADNFVTTTSTVIDVQDTKYVSLALKAGDTPCVAYLASAGGVFYSCAKGRTELQRWLPRQLVHRTPPLDRVHGVSLSFAGTATGSTTIPKILFFDEAANRIISATLEPIIVSVVVSPGPNEKDWFNRNVTVNLTAHNRAGPCLTSITSSVMAENSRSSPNTVSLSQFRTLLIAEGLNRVTYFAQDVAGNSTPLQTLKVNIDKTPPIIRPPTISGGTLNSNGWYTTGPLRVEFTCDDTAPSGITPSGVKQCVTSGGNSGFATEGVTSFLGTAEDNAGNRAERRIEIKLDRKTPTLRCSVRTGFPGCASLYDLSGCARAEDNWVSVAFDTNASDNTSGLAHAPLLKSITLEDDNCRLSTSDVQGFQIGQPVTEGRVRMFACNGKTRTYVFTYYVKDKAGNVSTSVSKFRVHLAP